MSGRGAVRQGMASLHCALDVCCNYTHAARGSALAANCRDLPASKRAVGEGWA